MKPTVRLLIVSLSFGAAIAFTATNAFTADPKPPKSNLPRPPGCRVPCDAIQQRVWRLSAARDAMKQLYQHLGA